MSDKAYTAKDIAECLKKSKQAVMKRAAKENWPFIEINGKGGKTKKYPLISLPSDVQGAILIYKKDKNPDSEGQIAAMLPALSPSAAAIALEQMTPMELPTFAEALSTSSEGNKSWTPETAISEADLLNPRIKKILAILRDVENMPRTWAKGKRKWIETVAMKHEVRWQSIYRWLQKYDKRGIAGLRHTKSCKDQPKVWTPEALDWWISLCLKPAHRKIDLKSLYTDVLRIEAHRRGWQVGCCESATWWFNKRATPTMLAMQKGGLRALDNILPPVLRDYSDLAPFEMLVGDQHRFDFWVVDDDTGQVFRPECFMWQDLRTRLIYGMAFDYRYDAHLCGLALRVGMHLWGCFGSIYTDNGSSELSKYMMGIMAEMRNLGMEWQMTVDLPVDLLDVEAEEINPVITPGTHKKAVVKNAKAKMIEGTFCKFENILRSHYRLAGSVKRLTDDILNQDKDHEEAMKLAADGRLLLASEFYLICYQAADFYNREKIHRGVKKEWTWKPVPAAVTPFDCLKACYRDGWRPKKISDSAADLMFLKKASRVVNRGRININNEIYEHDALTDLHGQRVDIRHNPIEGDIILVFHRGQYICNAVPIEYSSMKDNDLAKRKILEKRARRRHIAERFRSLVSNVPDFREYSQVPEIERVAALIGTDRTRKAIENKEMTRPVSQEELNAHIERMEKGLPLPPKQQKPLPERPKWFMDDFGRYQWLLGYLKAGGDLNTDDAKFIADYENEMAPAERERWQFERENIEQVAQGGN